MTKEEYAQARDEFAAVAASISALTVWFQPPDGVLAEHGWDWEAALDEYGYYMTGSEYRLLNDCRQFFESLSGRNAARAL